jgi:HlyD family secretion protein
MKRTPIILLAIALLAAGWLAIQQFTQREDASTWQTVTLQRGELTVSVSANGVVSANQTAVLAWRTTGSVNEVNVKVGEFVASGQVLATLKQSSLPQALILAQADLIQAQRALDDLQNSQTQQSQARLAVEQAQKALDDARSPLAAQAQAQRTVAEAEKLVEAAQRRATILETPASASAIEQAKASLLLAENVLNRTLDNIERIERKLKKPESAYLFFESRELYRDILKNLELKRARDQRAYEEAQNRYNRLLEPANESDLAVARADLLQAQAQLDQAQREWERIQAGANPADLAVLEARLADAQREWERVKDGPTQADLTSAEARVAAAQAAVNMGRLSAPFAGVITQVSNQGGDQVEPGSPAFRLDDLSRLLVTMQVSEVDINRIEVGQPAILTFDSIPGREYSGVVTAVPRVGDELQGVGALPPQAGANAQGIIVFNTEVEISRPDEQIRPGMTSAVEVVTAKLEDTLLVPNSAVRFSGGQRVVYILRDDQPVSVVVRLGPPTESYSPLLEGDLQAGDLIVTNPPTAASADP